MLAVNDIVEMWFFKNYFLANNKQKKLLETKKSQNEIVAYNQPFTPRNVHPDQRET